MKNLFQNRAVGFWLDLAGTVLTLVGIILYALYAADTGSNNVWGYIGLVAAVAAGAAGLVTDNDLLAIAAPALSAVSLCAFITDSVYTFVGYFFGLAMFGDVGQNELFLELVVQIIVDLRVGQRIDDALEKARAGLFQPALDLLLLLKFLLGNIAFEKVEKAHRGPPYF